MSLSVSFLKVCLSLTAKRLARKNCVVKNLEAVETLGIVYPVVRPREDFWSASYLPFADDLLVSGGAFNSQLLLCDCTLSVSDVSGSNLTLYVLRFHLSHLL